MLFRSTLRAIKAHQLPWPQIINAQSVPTDLYGISGIPCIMLIGPDGTILTRDLQGEELKAAVRAALDPLLIFRIFCLRGFRALFGKDSLQFQLWCLIPVQAFTVTLLLPQ